MEKRKMRFAPSGISLLNVELLVSVNFKHFWIGAILRAREWTLAQHNDSLAVVVKTFLPTTEGLPKPRFSLFTDATKLRNQKEKQRRFYNHGICSLAPLKPGEAREVLGRTSRGTWTQGICLKEVSPRSYDIRVDGVVRRRNRIEMWLTNEQPLEDVAVYFTPLPLAEPMVPSIPVSTPSALPSVAEPTPTPELSPNPM